MNHLGKISSIFYVFTFLAFSSVVARGNEIVTNNIQMANAPDWLTESRVERATQQVQSVLEWDIRRVKTFWYSDQAPFESLHGMGPKVQAFSRNSDNTVHLGPQVKNENFEPIFEHELTHVIIFQKYKPAIPAWVEEGLGNYVAKKGTVDYGWLAQQNAPPITSLRHPFKGAEDSRYHYMASTAVVEMIAAKCSLSDLLQLSVGKKMETYLSTYCNLSNVDEEFKKWVAEKAKGVSGKKPTPTNPKKR